MLKHDNSGWVAIRVIELGEHEIEFKPRKEIKGQVLADFLAEPQEGDDEKDKETSKCMMTILGPFSVLLRGHVDSNSRCVFRGP